MKVTKEQIELFIPQRAPFIMIDNLIDANADTYITDFQILSDNIFLEEGIFREFGLIENIAQSSAAGIGYNSISSSSKAKSIDGFLGAISKLKVYALPKVNDTIKTVVTRIHQFGNMYLLKGENFVNGEKFMECEVKLVGLMPNQTN